MAAAPASLAFPSGLYVCAGRTLSRELCQRAASKGQSPHNCPHTTVLCVLSPRICRRARSLTPFAVRAVRRELLTGKIPYSDMTPLQAAVGVVQKGLRPPLPPNCPPPLADASCVRERERVVCE